MAILCRWVLCNFHMPCMENCFYFDSSPTIWQYTNNSFLMGHTVPGVCNLALLTRIQKSGRWKHRRLHEDKFRSNWQVSTGPVFARMNQSLLDTQIVNQQSHSSLIDLEHTISEYKSMGWTWSKHSIYMYQILSWQEWRKITWRDLHSVTASFIHPCS